MIHLKYRVITLLLLLFCPFISYGQKFLYKGQVINYFTLEPLSYVNLVLKGTPAGTFTDWSGEFAIMVEVNDSLIISHIGYLPLTILVAKNQKKIKLKPQPDILEEVIINAPKRSKKKS